MEGTWQLPVLERRTINEQYIKHNAKYHYYDYVEQEQPGISPLAKSMCASICKELTILKA